MVKVFLVEDEVIIREGIKKKIDWETNGLVFCGEASDGELAFPLIQKEKPDIVITDIRMPFMDGLELSKLVKKELPQTRIVILSGYGEFEYAKKGIDIGVDLYLLKPISGEELLKEIKVLAGQIGEEQREREVKEKFLVEMQENEEERKRQFFQELVGGSQSMPVLLEKGDKLGIKLSASWYNLILLKIKQPSHGEEEFSEQIVRIEEEMKEFIQAREDSVLFDRGLEGLALLLKASELERLEQEKVECVERIKQIAEGCGHVVCFGGIGTPVNRLRELNHCFEEASRAYAYRFILDGNHFVEASAEGRPSVREEKEEFTSLSLVNPGELDKRKVDQFLKGGDREEIAYFVEEYLCNLGNAGENSILFRQYLIMDMYFAVVRFLGEIGSEESVGEPFQSQGQMDLLISSLEQSRGYIKTLFEKAIQIRDEISVRRYGSIVEEACSCVEENYAQEELSLNWVAHQINISPSHLSSVFSQETGQTFVKYLTEYRMNRAKELLKCTSKKSSEIGALVGYKDSHYFSYLFKKKYGMTPIQYRNKREEELL